MNFDTAQNEWNQFDFNERLINKTSPYEQSTEQLRTNVKRWTNDIPHFISFSLGILRWPIVWKRKKLQPEWK